MLVDFILHAALAIGALQMLIDLFLHAALAIRGFADAYFVCMLLLPSGFADAC